MSVLYKYIYINNIFIFYFQLERRKGKQRAEWKNERLHLFLHSRSAVFPNRVKEIEKIQQSNLCYYNKNYYIAII